MHSASADIMKRPMHSPMAINLPTSPTTLPCTLAHTLTQSCNTLANNTSHKLHVPYRLRLTPAEKNPITSSLSSTQQPRTAAIIQPHTTTLLENKMPSFLARYRAWTSKWASQLIRSGAEARESPRASGTPASQDVEVKALCDFKLKIQNTSTYPGTYH